MDHISQGKARTDEPELVIDEQAPFFARQILQTSS